MSAEMQQEVREIVERNARAVFRNNHRTFNAIRYAEEAAIYSTESGEIEWENGLYPHEQRTKEVKT